MIQKLKNKGYVSSPHDKDILVGEFNGADVRLYVVTNNNKVYRIMVADVNTKSESDIKIRFNELCRQFQNNENYISLSDCTLSDKEDISYEMSVHAKRYQADYYQKPAVDSVAIAEEINPFLLSKYTEEQLSNPTEELQQGILKTSITYVLEKCSKKSVWFMINEFYGKYYIAMYYDNGYNKANGEEL